MFRLHILQARYGDCLLLEFGPAEQPHYVLIDGGPPRTYENHLRGELQRLAARWRTPGSAQAAATLPLDLVVLSHVDNDHVVGLLDLTAELREQRAAGETETVAIGALWHNAFEDTIGRGNDIEARLASAMAGASQATLALTGTGIALQGIGEGRQLRRDALLLGIPLNVGFDGGLVSVDTAPPAVQLGDLALQIVGPTEDNLEELQEKWEEWLDKHADDIASGDPLLAAMADRSVPNLSSIVLLARCQGRTILLTGDGRGDHLLQGLRQAGLLDELGHLHVDVLKVAHHGSDRNATRHFFRQVTADQYAISADGLHGNPDLATMIWIVEGAREDERQIEILVTNRTPASEKLLQEYPPEEYGYRLSILDPDASALTLELVPAAEEEEACLEHE